MEQLKEAIAHGAFCHLIDLATVSIRKPSEERGVRNVRRIGPVELMALQLEDVGDRLNEALVVDRVGVGERPVDIEDSQSMHG